ncbi:MAG: HAD hydrolase family protein [Candidatus Omnitrophota bacterium]
MKKLKLLKQGIDLIVYDFDGVMTDNKAFFFEDAREAVLVNRSDGLAVSIIKKSGIPQIIISTEPNKVVQARARKLKIPCLYNISDKKAALIMYCRKMQFDIKKTIYIGNDINDFEAMKIAGIPMAPLDASVEIRRMARVIINVRGGDGVIRGLLNLLNLERAKEDDK